MDVLYPHCAGLDIHRDTIVACVRLAEAGGVIRVVETFATTTTELERLSDWLSGHKVTHVAMEATGVYWKPVWAVLAGDFELVLANAHHVKAVPGRKTDVNDATWLADLLAHGLIRPSFVPSISEQALRDLTRARKQLTREKASHVQRIDKTLQAANIKLGSVLSNIMGQSGRVLLEALAAGESDPERLAGLVRTKIRASHAQVVEAVRGRLAAHQRLLLRLYLAQVDALDAAIAAIDHELGVNRAGFLGGILAWITRLGQAPPSERSSALRLRPGARCRVVRSTRVPMAELPSPRMRSPSQWPGTARSAASAGRWLIRISGPMQDLPRPRLRARGTRNARPVRRQAVSSRRSAPRPCTYSAW